LSTFKKNKGHKQKWHNQDKTSRSLSPYKQQNLTSLSTTFRVLVVITKPLVSMSIILANMHLNVYKFSRFYNKMAKKH